MGKEDLQALSDMLKNDVSSNDVTGENNSTNELAADNSQTQSQSQNVSIITNIYNQGAGGQHHHRHYHLLLLSDDGQAQGKISWNIVFTLYFKFNIMVIYTYIICHPNVFMLFYYLKSFL